MTIESSQYCFLGVQRGKHLLQKQNVSEKKKSETFFLPRTRKQKMLPQQMFRSRANGETFTETCFLSIVFATMFPCLWGLIGLILATTVWFEVLAGFHFCHIYFALLREQKNVKNSPLIILSCFFGRINISVDDYFVNRYSTTAVVRRLNICFGGIFASDKQKSLDFLANRSNDFKKSTIGTMIVF